MTTRTTAMVDCQKCGKNSVECTYVENGDPNSYIDNFYHKCTNPACDYEAKQENVWAGTKDYEDDWPNCPFCGRSCYSTGVR